MSRDDDFSGEHFDWLVAGRTQSQTATLALYKIISANNSLLNSDLAMRKAAHDLVGVTFSLWRAVFLSDLSGEVADQLADIKTFLQILIAHNTVLYQTDFTAREWSFEYYLDNALLRLRSLPDFVLPADNQAVAASSAKEKWKNAQAALDAAIAAFAREAVERSR